MPYPKREHPRIPVLVRFEPDLIARVDAIPGDTRVGKIIDMIELGLETLTDALAVTAPSDLQPTAPKEP